MVAYKARLGEPCSLRRTRYSDLLRLGSDDVSLSMKPGARFNIAQAPTGNRTIMNLQLSARLACFAFISQPLTTLALTPSQVFDKVKDSVVVVKTLNEEGDAISQGSGVLLPSGKIATNCHVVKNGVRFQVGRGQNLAPATFFAGDEDKDICLLQADKITGTPTQLGTAATLKVGEAVYAIGAPKGLELSLSDGIVSALRGGMPPLIQTTAAISPGSSGGGLFDSEGRLVGLTTLYIDDGQSLNFAMPVEWLNDIKPGKKTASKQRGEIDWLTRAAKLEGIKNWSTLLDWGMQWVRADPESAHAWFFIGDAYQGLKQLDQAIAAYRQALRINPENIVIWYKLGNAYYFLERYEDAITAYRQALRINPSNADSWYDLAMAYYRSGNTPAALQAVKSLALLDPIQADKLFNWFVPR